MFGQLTGEDESDGSLNFAGGDGGFLVVGCKFGGFSGDTFEDVVDEGVEDGHGFVGDTSVGMDLFQDYKLA